MLKKTFILVLVVLVLVLGWLQVRAFRLNFAAVEGKKARIARGPITVPIEATGEVLPARRIEIKAEASGEVLSILKQAGDLVRKGDVIMELDKAEEERNLDRANNTVNMADARLEIARLQLEMLNKSDLPRADQVIEAADAKVDVTRFQWEEARDNHAIAAPEMEKRIKESSYISAKAELAQANISKDALSISIRKAEQDIKQAQADLESAQRSHADAAERVQKTRICSPIDGMIGEVRTQVGEIVQGGKTTVTGGTLLATVIDTTKIIVRAEVDEAEIGRVHNIAPDWAKPGNDGSIRVPTDWEAESRNTESPPSIRVDTFPKDEFVGVIERIHPEPRKVQEAVYYYVDVVLVSQNRNKLFKGMRADVTFTSERADDVLLCPNEAIVEGPNKQLGVRVPDTSAGAEENATKFIPVELGLTNSVYYEVKSGLEEGMEVYTKLPVAIGGKK